MSYKVVSDSSSNVLTMGNGNFASVPMKVRAAKEYVDDQNLDLAAMVADLKAHKGTSGSACPSVGEWLDAFGDADMVFCTTMSKGLSGIFRPLLRRLLPQASKDEKTLAAISANLSANLLGLGNAATPLGIQAARRMARGCNGVASNELCLLVVLNTASIQLLPATIASLRAAAGCRTPFDILPAVWFASVLSVSVGVLTAHLLSRIGGSP